MGDWFQKCFGFREGNWQATRGAFDWDAERDTLTVKLSGKEFAAGRFACPSLEELRQRVNLRDLPDRFRGSITVREEVGDVTMFHIDPRNAFSVFQAASQFNGLEFVSQYKKPEDGITCYQGDHTQGPACATACGPGTMVRNYFALNGEGQTAAKQVENLKDVEVLLNNDAEGYIRVVGGYTMASSESLGRLTARLAADERLREAVCAKLRVGVQEDTQVTGSNFGSRSYTGDKLLVTQVYSSACSVSYSGVSASKWEAFASLVLNATYEATLYAAVENWLRHPDEPGARRVFLTAVGGGVFGNEIAWIAEAMKLAFEKFAHVGLEIVIVSFGGRTPPFRPLLTEAR